MRTTTLFLCVTVLLAGAATAQASYPAPAPEWQLNSAPATLTIDGIQGTVPEIVTVPMNTMVTITGGSVLRHPAFDICIVAAPMVPASGGGLRLGRQIVNVDLRNLDIFAFANSGSIFPSLQPFPGDFAVGIDSGSIPGTGSAQMILLDPAMPEGFVLSQPIQLDVVANAG
jgi:hypothetical protein